MFAFNSYSTGPLFLCGVISWTMKSQFFFLPSPFQEILRQLYAIRLNCGCYVVKTLNWSTQLSCEQFRKDRACQCASPYSVWFHMIVLVRVPRKLVWMTFAYAFVPSLIGKINYCKKAMQQNNEGRINQHWAQSVFERRSVKDLQFMTPKL